MRRPRVHTAVALALAIATTALVGIAAWSWSGAYVSPSTRNKSASKLTKEVGGDRHPQLAAPPANLAWATAKASTVQPASASQPVRTTKQPAHVEPFEQTAIYAKAAGFASKVHVDLGSRVKKGDVLAELWIPEMQQERAQKQALVEEAKASVTQAEATVLAGEALLTAARAKVLESKSHVSKYEAELAFRRSEHARISDLVRSKAVEEALLDEKLKQMNSAQSALAAAHAGIASAEANVQVEQARVEQAHANVVLAKARQKVASADLKRTDVLIEYAVIRAPYDGVVTERLVNTGDFAQSAADGKSGPLFTVMRPEPMRIVADIPEADAAWMRADLEATLTVDSIKGRMFAGTIRRLSDQLDPKTRTLRIEVEVSDSADGLRCGMYGAIEIAEPILHQIGDKSVTGAKVSP